jgi:hypothetical protein
VEETKQQPEKPKRPKREKAAIVPLPPPVEIRLGSLAIQDPKEMIHRAAGLATALSEIVNTQMDEKGKPKLFVEIQGRKYIKADGWTTLGAMLGVIPIEESCTRLPAETGFKGFEAKVKLVRMVDGVQVGGASAECTLNEKNWSGKDSFSLRSMAITRATGKAFRLSFAWIVQLAGFEPVPADELWEQGSEEEAQEIAKKKIDELEKKAEKQTAKEIVFITWPAAHNGHKALFIGQTAVRKCGAEALMMKTGNWNDRDMGWYVARENVPELAATLVALGCPVIDKDNPDLTQLLKKSLEMRANGDTQGRTGPTPVS